MIEWAFAFVVTEAIEVPIYALALSGRPWLRRLALAALPSLLTHPLVWLAVLRFGYPHYRLAVAGSELFAVVAEGLVLRSLGVRRSLVWALLANGASLVGGMACYWLRFHIGGGSMP